MLQVLWFLRHHENPPLHKVKGKNADDLVDRQLPELLFHMEELRALIKKYSQVGLLVESEEIRLKNCPGCHPSQ